MGGLAAAPLTCGSRSGRVGGTGAGGPGPHRADPHQPGGQRDQVLARGAPPSGSSPRLSSEPGHLRRPATRGAASPRTSWRPSSTPSSRSTPRTPGRRAAPGWGWPSAEGIVDRHGGRIWAESRPGAVPRSASRCRGCSDSAHRRWRCPADAPSCWSATTTRHGAQLSDMLVRHGYRPVGVTDGARRSPVPPRAGRPPCSSTWSCRGPPGARCSPSSVRRPHPSASPCSSSPASRPSDRPFGGGNRAETGWSSRSARTS